jgi:hypothetical protein
MMRLLLLLSAVAGTALAVNSIEQDFTCPFDSHSWRQRMETSASAKGMRLDLRQFGDVIQPPTLPQCPKCRAVLFMEKFDERTVDKLRPFVQGRDYQQTAEKYPSYYLLALIQEWTKAPPIFIGHSYLKASWQLEQKPNAMKLCLERSHANLSKAFALMKSGDADFVNTALLLGELERRLGRFDAAMERFRALGSAEQFKEAGFQRIIRREMELVTAGESGPRSIDDKLDAAAAAPPAVLTDSKPNNEKQPKVK